MEKTEQNPWSLSVKYGLLTGVVVLYLSLVGMVTVFNERYIISGVLSLGQALYFAPFLLFGYLLAYKSPNQSRVFKLLQACLNGLVGGLMIALFVALGQVVNLREVLINASPELYEILTFGVALPAGLLIPLLVGLVWSLFGSGIYLLEPRVRRAVVNGMMWVVLIGILRDMIVAIVARWGPLKSFFAWFFSNSGLTPLGAAIIFILVAGISYLTYRPKKVDPPPQTAIQHRQQNTIRMAAFSGLLLILPLILGIFFSEVLDNVGLYILMGLGLNIVVGYAGLLDLGYVAFFAIGAYAMGVLTSPELGFFSLTWWQALPIALGACVFAGVILGLPVLRMRGDYLAIVTLGFGEIIRIMVLSDWLRPFLGGTQGIQQIAKPTLGPITIDTQQEFYYLILVCIGIVAFVATRLKDSRKGRSWMALREDEDVAQAMGINTVITKLSAFAVGALFSGLAGTIFAAKLSSAYPHSFNLLVSINVLCLIIVGGIGSIPGVFVGALVLIGLPELLREFSEFRYLVYGALLIVMMLLRPEGLWPEARRRLELHEHEDTFDIIDGPALDISTSPEA